MSETSNPGPGESTADRIPENAANRKTVLNSLWAMAPSIARILCGTVVAVLVIRFLGKEDYGLLNSVTAFCAIFGLLSSLGMDQIVLRELVKEPEKSNQLVSTVLISRIVYGVILFAVALLIANRYEDRRFIAMAGILATAVFMRPFFVFDLEFQASENFRKRAVADLCGLVTESSLKVACVFAALPVLYFAGAQILGLAIATAFLIYFRSEWRSFPPWAFDKEKAKYLAKNCLPFLVGSVASEVYRRIDILMIYSMVGSAEAGIYAAATRLSELWYFVPRAIVAATTPQLLKRASTDRAAYLKEMQMLLKVLTLLGLVVAIVVAIACKPIVLFICGHQYAAAATVLAIHIWSGIFVSWDHAQGVWILETNRSYYWLNRAIVGAVVNVAANSILIPHYGAAGAAFATLISYACFCMVSNLVYKPAHEIFAMQMKSFWFGDLNLSAVRSFRA